MFLPFVPLLFGQQVFYLESAVVAQYSVMRCFLHSSTLLAFLFELLKSSVAMQEQMLGGKGFLVIGYLLEKVTTVFVCFSYSNIQFRLVKAKVCNFRAVRSTKRNCKNKVFQIGFPKPCSDTIVETWLGHCYYVVPPQINRRMFKTTHCLHSLGKSALQMSNSCALIWIREVI